MKEIEQELEERLKELREQGKLLEAQRLEQRTRYDLEMMREMGFCSGIENYSRHLTFGKSRENRLIRCWTIFPKTSLIIVDESHVTFRKFAGCTTGTGAKGDVGGAWFPASVGNGQPAAYDLKSLKRKINQIILCFGDTGSL